MQDSDVYLLIKNGVFWYTRASTATYYVEILVLNLLFAGFFLRDAPLSIMNESDDIDAVHLSPINGKSDEPRRFSAGVWGQTESWGQG